MSRRGDGDSFVDGAQAEALARAHALTPAMTPRGVVNRNDPIDVVAVCVLGGIGGRLAQL